MKPPSIECSSSLAMVGSGAWREQQWDIEVVGGSGYARLEKLRRVGGGGSNGGEIEVVGGICCARLKKLRRVEVGGGGGVDGSNNNCSREGDNNVDKNIVIETTERNSRNICSLRSAHTWSTYNWNESISTCLLYECSMDSGSSLP